jgi:hypothetical protein
MIIYYDKNTGEINSVMHDECDISKAMPTETQDVKISYVEYGRDAFYLYVSPETKELTLRSGLLLTPDKTQISIGESVRFKIDTDKSFTSLTFVVNGTSIKINNTEFDIKFDYPGVYYIAVNDVEYFSYPVIINVS